MTVEKKINIGLIGSGAITRFIHVPGFQLCHEVEVLVACDADQEIAQTTAEMFGIPNVTTDFREVITDSRIDAVVIATPNYLHRPICLEAFENRKNVLSEKPLGLTLAESKEMLKAAEESNLIHAVSFVYRFAPAMRYLKYLIDSKTLGEIRHFRAQYLQKVPDIFLGWRSKSAQAGRAGALGDIGPHLIDFARLLVGEIKAVSGWTKTFLPQRQVAGTTRYEDCDVDDASGFITEFSNGATGVFEVSRLVPGRGCGKNEFQSVEVNGTKGSAIYHLQDPFNLQVFPGHPYNDGHLYSMPVPETFLKEAETSRRVIDHECNVGFRYDQAFSFIQAIRGNPQCLLPTFKDGERSQAVVDAVLESAASRKWVTVSD